MRGSVRETASARCKAVRTSSAVSASELLGSFAIAGALVALVVLAAILPATHAVPMASAQSDGYSQSGEYVNTSAEYKTARTAFVNAQALLENCGDCDQAGKEYTATAGKYLTVTADLLHQHLLLLDERVMSSQNPELRDELRQQIASLDSEVNGTRATAAALSAASTPAELDAVQQKVQGDWSKVDLLTQMISGRLTMDKMETSIDQLVLLRKNLMHTRDNLHAMGVDTIELDTHLSGFSRDLALAQAQEYNARLHYEMARNVLNASEVAEFNNTVTEAKEPLERAMTGLQQITRDIKQLFEKNIVA